MRACRANSPGFAPTCRSRGVGRGSRSRNPIRAAAARTPAWRISSVGRVTVSDRKSTIEVGGGTATKFRAALAPDPRAA